MIRILLISIILFTGCKKATDRPCWKNAGENITDIRELPNKSTLNIFDDIDVILIKDSLDFIEIESYSNLFSFIEINTIDTAMEFRNLNRCDFVRKKDISNSIKVHYSNIDKLNIYGTGDVTFMNTITQEYLEINSYNSRSAFTLDVSCHKLQCVFIEGSMEANISGTSDSTYIFQSQYSIVNATDLANSYLHFSNNSTGDCHVRATDKLAVELLDVGNIYYKGNPTLKILADIGLGDLIIE